MILAFRLSLLSCLGAVLFTSMAFGTNANKDSVAFKKLIDDDWSYLMKEYPEWATWTGYPGQNDRWTDNSLAAIEKREQRPPQMLDKLAKISRDRLSKADQLNYDLLKREWLEDVEGKDFPGELLPINQMGGPQIDVADLISVMPKDKVSDFDNIIARLEKLPTVIDQTIVLMKKGAGLGITPPKITLRDVATQIKAQMEPDIAKHPMMAAFNEIPASVPKKDAEALKVRAAAVIERQVLPAYAKLYDYFTKEYEPKARETIGLSALPNGKAWYAYKARVETTTKKTPQEIHEIGLAEVKRIRAKMEQVIKDVKFDGDFDEFTTFLRKDDQFFFTDAASLVAGYRDIAKRIDFELPKLFGKLPRLPYGVKPVPAYSEKSQTTAYYYPGSPDTNRPGIFYANTYDLKSRPKWEMEALTLHEAVPGHHLQIALAQEQGDLPEFRKNGGYTAYVEGWGLYSESLGEELGFFTDPYSKFGQLTYEMWRAVRLVVDTGMHDMGWTRDQAIKFFEDNTGKANHDIIVEVDRYIVWPGQALAYKIGELKLKELRAYASKELGGKFDVRAFHDKVLEGGAVPLDILEKNVKEWVAAGKAKGST